jgi:hypothetical protein
MYCVAGLYHQPWKQWNRKTYVVVPVEQYQEHGNRGREKKKTILREYIGVE